MGVNHGLDFLSCCDLYVRSTLGVDQPEHDRLRISRGAVRQLNVGRGRQYLETPLLRTGLGRLLVSWVVEAVVFGCVLARHLSNRAVTLEQGEGGKGEGGKGENKNMACSPFLGPVIMGVTCSLVHWTRDRAGLHR
jgi:hypothetical protein